MLCFKTILTKNQFKEIIKKDKELINHLKTDWVLIGSYEYTLSYAFNDKLNVLYRKPRKSQALYKILYTDHYDEFIHLN
jgi:hypothetical protein